MTQTTLDKGYQSLDQSMLTSFKHQDYVRWLQHRGKEIVLLHNTYWMKIANGFYQPPHLLDRLTGDFNEELLPVCWGLRWALPDSEEAKANGHILVYGLSDLDNYDMSVLSSNRRNQLRRSYKRAQIVEITSPEIMRLMGHGVMKSSLERTQHRSVPPREVYLNHCNDYLNTGNNHSMVVAGLVDGQMAGYMEVYAVGGVAYLETLYIATEFLNSYVSIGMTYDFIQLCRRSPDVHYLVHGQYSMENQSLSKHKKSLGFTVDKIPSYIKISRPMSTVLKLCYPNKYRRLVGELG